MTKGCPVTIHTQMESKHTIRDSEWAPVVLRYVHRDLYDVPSSSLSPLSFDPSFELCGVLMKRRICGAPELIPKAQQASCLSAMDQSHRPD